MSNHTMIKSILLSKSLMISLSKLALRTSYTFIKRATIILFLLIPALSAFAQDHYEKKYSLGQTSGGKWYKLMSIDLNDNGNYNSINITLDLQYVNTWTKYNSKAILRFREGPTSSSADYQSKVSGTNTTIIKLKKTGAKTYDILGYSNGGWGHMYFSSIVNKEAPLMITIPDIPVVADITQFEDAPVKGDWYFPLGQVAITKSGTIGGVWNPSGSFLKIADTGSSSMIIDSNEIYGSGTLHLGSKTGDIIKFRTISENSTSDKMVIKANGKVGIGTNNPDSELSVNGKIHTKEVKVDMTGWADYVFDKGYQLPTLQEVEQHIKENGHLQNIPSTKEVEENGIELGEMNKKLLEKIEQLTLYIIKQDKRITQLEEAIK